jgi:hypothetical protein
VQRPQLINEPSLTEPATWRAFFRGKHAKDPTEPLIQSSFQRMPEKWCMDAPLTDLRMESMFLTLPDPGLRRDEDK